MNDETWLRLSITYPATDDENVEMYFFEQEIFAILYAAGAASINEQDDATLGADTLPKGCKRLDCYFDNQQAVQAAEVRAVIEQKARAANIPLESSLDSFTDQSWKDGWKKWFVPAQVSPRLAVRTPWSEFDPKPGVQVIVIEPGMAFGTGLHETTQLCLQGIDEISANGSIHSMLDVGCGSGVLSIAASLCGIPRVRGIDNDPVAVSVSLENALRNHVGATFDATDIWDISESFDLVVANIISSVLKPLKEDIKAALKPGATLLLSGILTEEVEEVKAAYLQDLPIKHIRTQILGEWCSLTFERLP